MHLPVTRIDASLPLPAYATSGSAAFDLAARETTVVPPGQVALIPANVVVAIPEGHVLFISSRSSTGRKKGLHVPLGVIDRDYCGPEDELRIQAWNLTSEPVTVERGERVAQALLMPVARAELVEMATTTSAVSRGGFGTTGA
jgi:dUTP pyrophosphatase